MSGALAGKVGLVFGVANKRSIAWAIAQGWAEAGATLIFNYQGERVKENVEELVGTFGENVALAPCDVSSDEEIKSFFRVCALQNGSRRYDVALRRVRAQRGSGGPLRRDHARCIYNGARHQLLLAGGSGARNRSADD
jgi:enoyl-[acyl-carrier-protein] reductase (NADH)